MPARYRILEAATRQFIRERTREPDGTNKGDGLAKFAAYIGISVGQLSRILNGRVDLTWEMRSRIADGLGVPPAAIGEEIRDRDTDTQAVNT
jgi:transcriptional regulator with XRE-family HTH domain